MATGSTAAGRRAAPAGTDAGARAGTDVAAHRGGGTGIGAGTDPAAGPAAGTDPAGAPDPGAVVDRAAVVRRPSGPFTPRQLDRLDEAMTMASRETGLTFSVYVGGLGEPAREHAERLHAGLGPIAPGAVLIAVSPGQRVVHVVTGEASVRRLPDRLCALAVLSMQASFSVGDLVGGIVNGLRMLADQAGLHRP